jgi:hypothetical protein
MPHVQTVTCKVSHFVRFKNLTLTNFLDALRSMTSSEESLRNVIKLFTTIKKVACCMRTFKYFRMRMIKGDREPQEINMNGKNGLQIPQALITGQDSLA